MTAPCRCLMGAQMRGFTRTRMPARTRKPWGPFAPCLLSALLAAGCASSDLTGDADVRREVVICLPPDTPAPVQVVRAVWFPNWSGLGSTDSSPVHMTGVLALAGYRIWFMSWNDSEHHYDMQHSVDCLQAQKVAVDSVGPSSMLVIQSGNDLYDSFELMNRGQFASDAASTREFCARIEALRARGPRADP